MTDIPPPRSPPPTDSVIHIWCASWNVSLQELSYYSSLLSKDEVSRAGRSAEVRNLAREYLQGVILQSLQLAGAIIGLAFHGDTVLRFPFSLPRFSEDLDFALEGIPATCDFRAYLQSIRKDLEAQGYTITLKVNDKKNSPQHLRTFS